MFFYVRVIVFYIEALEIASIFNIFLKEILNETYEYVK